MADIYSLYLYVCITSETTLLHIDKENGLG